MMNFPTWLFPEFCSDFVAVETAPFVSFRNMWNMAHNWLLSKAVVRNGLGGMCHMTPRILLATPHLSFTANHKGIHVFNLPIYGRGC